MSSYGERISEIVKKKNVKTFKRSSSLEEVTLNVNNVNCCSKALYLVDRFKQIGCDDADNCYNFFVKCFKNLSENTIWGIYENATSNPAIKSSIKYFIAACRNQLSQ